MVDKNVLLDSEQYDNKKQKQLLISNWNNKMKKYLKYFWKIVFQLKTIKIKNLFKSIISTENYHNKKL